MNSYMSNFEKQEYRQTSLHPAPLKAPMDWIFGWVCRYVSRLLLLLYLKDGIFVSPHEGHGYLRGTEWQTYHLVKEDHRKTLKTSKLVVNTAGKQSGVRGKRKNKNTGWEGKWGGNLKIPLRKEVD